jgi:hypothetical protein
MSMFATLSNKLAVCLIAGGFILAAASLSGLMNSALYRLAATLEALVR